jgi:hypothetical protein
MSVVAFERKQNDGGMTEKGDAQFYLLGPLPDQACELCVSRIGGRYILEDGSGRLLFEHRNLDLVVLHARAAIPSTSWLMVRVIILWCAIRNVLHERIEPMLAEGEELLVQWAPQLAAFA